MKLHIAAGDAVSWKPAAQLGGRENHDILGVVRKSLKMRPNKGFPTYFGMC